MGKLEMKKPLGFSMGCMKGLCNVESVYETNVI